MERLQEMVLTIWKVLQQTLSMPESNWRAICKGGSRRNHAGSFMPRRPLSSSAPNTARRRSPPITSRGRVFEVLSHSTQVASAELNVKPSMQEPHKNPVEPSAHSAHSASLVLVLVLVLPFV